MNATKIEIAVTVCSSLLFVVLLLWSTTRINYHITARHLQVTWLGLPVRRIRLDDIKYISTKPSVWGEKWFNTLRVGNRLLVIHRRSGWFRHFLISPKNPFVFKTELYEARKQVMPLLPRSTTLSRTDTAHVFHSAPAPKAPPPAPPDRPAAG
jgi:hypothetical protein